MKPPTQNPPPGPTGTDKPNKRPKSSKPKKTGRRPRRTSSEWVVEADRPRKKPRPPELSAEQAPIAIINDTLRELVKTKKSPAAVREAIEQLLGLATTSKPLSLALTVRRLIMLAKTQWVDLADRTAPAQAPKPDWQKQLEAMDRPNNVIPFPTPKKPNENTPTDRDQTNEPNQKATAMPQTPPPDPKAPKARKPPKAAKTPGKTDRDPATEPTATLFIRTLPPKRKTTKMSKPPKTANNPNIDPATAPEPTATPFIRTLPPKRKTTKLSKPPKTATKPNTDPATEPTATLFIRTLPPKRKTTKMSKPPKTANNPNIDRAIEAAQTATLFISRLPPDPKARKARKPPKAAKTPGKTVRTNQPKTDHPPIE